MGSETAEEQRDATPSVVSRGTSEGAASTAAPKSTAASKSTGLLGRVYPITFALFFSVVSVSCWGMAGNACRIGLNAAFHGKNFFVGFANFGPNAIGSFVMGFFVNFWPGEAEFPFLYRGLCAGFCGCFTTMSGWILNIVNSASVAGGAEELISGLLMPVMFYFFGADIGRLCGRNWKSTSQKFGILSSPRVHKVADTVILVLAVSAAIATPVTLYCILHYHRAPGEKLGKMSSDDLRNAVFAPVGAVPRFLLCLVFNNQPQYKNFPLGTLVSNVLGVLIAMLMYRGLYNATPSQWGYEAALTGICGALSTVSSFVSEVVEFYRRGNIQMAYTYLALTLAVTLTIAGIGRQKNFRSA